MYSIVPKLNWSCFVVVCCDAVGENNEQLHAHVLIVGSHVPA